FFQAEDGIRDFHVTGVQTCALPISIFTEQSIQIFHGWCFDGRITIQLKVFLNRSKNISALIKFFRSKIPGPFWNTSIHMATDLKIGRASCREGEKRDGGNVVHKNER